MTKEPMLRALKREVPAEYVPKSKDAMARGREQKEFLLKNLRGNTKIIENEWARATKYKQETFELVTPWDLTNKGAITHDRVADILRQWVFETYEGKLGLERYNDEKRSITFRIRESKSPVTEVRK